MKLNIKRIYLNIFTLFVCIFLNSCASLFPSPKDAPKRFILQSIDKKLTSLAPKRIAVDRISISPPFDSQRIVIQKTDQEIDYFANVEWVNRPSELMESAIFQSLLAANAFNSVSKYSDGMPSDISIKINIKSFSIRMLDRKAPKKKGFFSSFECENRDKQAVIECNAQLIYPRARKVFATKTFNLKKNVDSQNREGIGKSLDTAFTFFQEDLLQWAHSEILAKKDSNNKSKVLNKKSKNKKSKNKKNVVDKNINKKNNSGTILSRRL